MPLSTILIDTAAILAFALLVAGVVWAVLRAFLNRDPDAEEARPAHEPRPARTRWLLGIGSFLLVGMFVSFAHAAQTAFGVPIGERTTPVMEVVEVGECSSPVSGFGLVHRCEAAVGDPDMPSGGSHAEVVTGSETAEPGDRVAEYSSSGWTRWLQVLGAEPQWRSVDDTGRPNLVWLQAAALVLATLVLQRLDERLRARRRTAPAEPEVR